MTTKSLPVAGALAALGLLAGCGGEDHRPAGREADSTMSLPVRALADTGRATRLEVDPPPILVWVTRVSPSRAPDPASIPSPEPDAEMPPGEPPPPALTVDPDLKPPILRTPALLELPASRTKVPRSVELDVRVAEDGTVSDALWAGGSDDSVLVRAAVESALGMRFYAALKAGRPVAVWCRQRFDFRP